MEVMHVAVPHLILYVWLVIWSLVGSTLGFFTIRHYSRHKWTRRERIFEFIKSLCVGLFFALPIFTYLHTYMLFGAGFSVMIAGSASFAITDLIIQVWPKLMTGMSKLINHLIEKV